VSVRLVDRTAAVARAVGDRAPRILILLCALVAAVALTDLALRAALRLDENWDGLAYHLPFAAMRAGISIPYEISDQFKGFFEGFPPLPELTQGILWRLTGSVNAAGLANYLAFVLFLAYCHKILRAPFYLVALISLTAPLVLIHTTVLYVDLFGNALLAIGLSSCLYLYLFPETAGRAVIIGGLAGLTAAAWSKYQMAPIAGLAFCMLAILCWRSRRPIGVSRRQFATLLVLAVSLASIPYLKNLFVYGNPVWPIRVPIIGDMLPYLRNQLLDDVGNQQPNALRNLGAFPLFVRSLFEIDVPTHYANIPRWNVDMWGLGPHHCRPRIAVGTASRFSPSAMARSVAPEDRSATMRATISSGMSRGRPRRTPAAFLTASAAFVRSPMSRRSNWANTAMTAATISPCGVVVSTPTSSATSAHFSRDARSISPAKSSIERDRRSNLLTTRASALWWRRASRAAAMPGRLRSLPE